MAFGIMKEVKLVGFNWETHTPVFEDIYELQDEMSSYRPSRSMRSAPGQLKVLYSNFDRSCEAALYMIMNGFKLDNVSIYKYSHSSKSMLKRGMATFCRDTKSRILHKAVLYEMAAYEEDFIAGKVKYGKWLQRKYLTDAMTVRFSELELPEVHQEHLRFSESVTMPVHVSRVVEYTTNGMSAPTYGVVENAISDALYLFDATQFGTTATTNEIIKIRSKFGKGAGFFFKWQTIAYKIARRVGYQGSVLYYLNDESRAVEPLDGVVALATADTVKGGYTRGIHTCGAWAKSELETTTVLHQDGKEAKSFRQIVMPYTATAEQTEQVLRQSFRRIEQACKEPELQTPGLSRSAEHISYRKKLVDDAVRNVGICKVVNKGMHYRTAIADMLPYLSSIILDADGNRVVPEEKVMMTTPLRGMKVFCPGIKRRWLKLNRAPSIGDQSVFVENLYDNKLLCAVYGEDFKGLVMGAQIPYCVLQIDFDGDEVLVDPVSDEMEEWLGDRRNARRWSIYTPDDDESFEFEDLVEIQRLEHSIDLEDMAILAKANGVEWTRKLESYIAAEDVRYKT